MSNLQIPKMQVLTGADISRRLNVPASRIRKAILAGEIVPDAQAGRIHIFRASRLPRLANHFRSLALIDLPNNLGA